MEIIGADGADGYMDLTLKFNYQDVVSKLGEVTDGDVFPLFLTGNLLEDFGGPEVEESDCVIIRYKNAGKAISDTESPLPEEFVLFQNNSNPFNPETEISFQIPDATHIQLKIFNTLGVEICTLVNKNYEAGYHSINLNGNDNLANPVPSGLYLYQL